MKNRELVSAQQDMSLLGPIETAPAPGIRDKEAIKEGIVETLAPSNARQCCTTAMRSREDGGVVFSQNSVYGTRRLSVVDANIGPLVVSGAPQATVHAAAEKTADLIKATF